jgi:ketosteroid isomerase-like protein
MDDLHNSTLWNIGVHRPTVTGMSADTPTTTAIADLAYARFSHGFTDGQWDEFFDLVADEVDFAWPTAPGAGRFMGAEGREEMEQRFRTFGGDRRMTDINVTARNVSGDTVFYEDDSRGVMAGVPYHGRHCIIFTVRDGLVIGYREYVAQASKQCRARRGDHRRLRIAARKMGNQSQPGRTRRTGGSRTRLAVEITRVRSERSRCATPRKG